MCDTTTFHLILVGIDVTVVQERLGHASIKTTCRCKGISIETKRLGLRKFSLFEKSWNEAKPEGID